MMKSDNSYSQKQIITHIDEEIEEKESHFNKLQEENSNLSNNLSEKMLNLICQHCVVLEDEISDFLKK